MPKHLDQMPEVLRPRRETSREFFKNSFWDKFTRAHIWMPWASFFPLIIISLWYGISNNLVVPNISVLIFATGFITWTFTEYSIHRFLYHFTYEPRWKWLQNIQFAFHWLHHQYPRDKDRLIMPPFPGIPLAFVFFGLFYLLMGNIAYAFFPGFLGGYLYYITIHYYEHRMKNPKIPYYQKLWRHHFLHHFKYPNQAFGVSTRLWDRIFGTMPQEE